MKKLTTLLLTGTMVAAMSVSASAAMVLDKEVENPLLTIDGEQAIIDVAAGGYAIEDLQGARAVLTIKADPSEGFGGGVMFNSKSAGWVQTDDYNWCDPSGDKTLKVEGTDQDNYYFLTVEIPDGVFTAEDFDTDAKGYAQIFVQQWWGASDAEIALVGFTNPSGYPIHRGDSADDSADVAPIAFLAAMVAVAGITLAASKKRA